MFCEPCSIYADALDNVGRFVDMDTGEIIQQMSIRDFCLTDRWKPYVEKLRALRAQYGSEAKKMDEYVNTKKRLPGATLSGLFAVYNDTCFRRDGSTYVKPVSRRETHLVQHTGWLAIDIDLDDNKHLSDFDNIRMVCSFRPEIGLLMRSCSGSGYFGLVRLAYPERHKEQFKSLLKDYAALGITLDKQCGNIGRVRFASWDDPSHIYINERAVSYKGLVVETPTLQPSSTIVGRRSFHVPSSGVPSADSHDWHNDTPEIVFRKALRLVEKIEAKGVDVMKDYEGWVRCGISLYHIDPSSGFEMWCRISRFRPADSNAHRESELHRMWGQFARYSINANTFFMYCHDSQIRLSKDDYDEIYSRKR